MQQQEFFKLLDINHKYEISNLGSVRHIKSGNILNQQNGKNGYKRVMLSFENKKRKYFRVHRLVAHCFLSNTQNRPYINHIDGNKKNNTSGNLEWCTAKENDTHARLNGLKFQGVKVGCFNLKSGELIIFKSIGEAAEKTGLNKATVHRCLKKTYNKSIYGDLEFVYIQE